MSNSQFEIHDWDGEPDEVLLQDVASCLEVAWRLLSEVHGRALDRAYNSLDNFKLRDLLRRVMDAKLEVCVLKTRAQKRTASPPAVGSGASRDD